MLPGRKKIVASLLGTILAMSGCAQQGPFAERQNRLSALKSSVALLENQNAELKTKVTELSQDNRRLEDRLVQEESHNGDLAARLDDARNVISQRESSRGFSSFDDEPITKPVRRSTKPKRPPAASIPGPDNDSGSFETDPLDIPKPRFRSDGAQSYRTDDSTWLPIAQDTSEPKKYRLK